jgi:hypothetical protein
MLAVPILNLLFRHVVAERMGTILLSAILAHSGWHWMSERAGQLFAYNFYFPALNYAFFAALMRWLMLLIIIGVVIRLLVHLYDRFLKEGGAPQL